MEKVTLSGVPETMLQTLYARAKESQTRGAIYQDAIFDTKKKALPGADVPKKAKIKGFPQIFGLLEALFLYLVVWQAVSSVTGISCP